MRILIVGTTYHPCMNGQATFTTNLAEGLARREHDVTMVYPSSEGRAIRRMQNGVKLMGIQTIPLTFLHPEAFLSVYTPWTVRHVFDETQPDIVHIQDHYPLCKAFQNEARRRGIKVVGTNHFMPDNVMPYFPAPRFLQSAVNQILWKWMLSSFNYMEIVTTQSRAAADIVCAQGLRVPVFPVSCGINLDRFRPDSSVDRLAIRARYGIDPNRKIFLFVGRVDKEKRVDILLRAMQRIERDDIQLVIAGRGAEAAEYQALARSLHLNGRVHFTGFIPNEDLPVLLNSADVFTMPSEAELLSIATLEAMACGRPVLLADAVALPELVNHGENGYLFKPSDIDDAARYICLLAEQSDKWDAMGRVSLEKAHYHGLENTISRYETLYKDTLNKTS